LRLRADLKVLFDDIKTDRQTPVALDLEIRRLHPPKIPTLEHALQRSEISSDLGNVKPPPGVPTILLCAVNVSLVYSSLGSPTVVPHKRRPSDCEGFLDLSNDGLIRRSEGLSLIPYTEDLSEYSEDCLVSQGLLLENYVRNVYDNNHEALTTPGHFSSKETFADLFGSLSDRDCDDVDSIVFSSQGSTFLQSQKYIPPEAASGHASSAQIQMMTMLVDGALRNLICPKPIGTAPGMKTDTSTMQTRLTDLAPSTFSPGYAEAVAARAPLVPTIARFLTSFLQRARNSTVTTKKDELVRHSSDMQLTENVEESAQEQDEEGTLKEVLKSQIWMTMTNGLRDPEPARRLKPLDHFARPDSTDPNCLHDTENTTDGCHPFGKARDDIMLEEDQLTRPGPSCQEGDDDDLLDFYEDDEADDYDYDLFEAYEAGLRNYCDLETAGKLMLGDEDHDQCVDRRLATHDRVDGLLSSPMLEQGGIFPQPKPLGQTFSTSSSSMLDFPSTTPPRGAIRPHAIGSNGNWCDLLEEEPSTGDINSKELSQPSNLIDVDWELDFDQWEFDVERGSDEMLF
jgi:hypothetical protein